MTKETKKYFFDIMVWIASKGSLSNPKAGEFHRMTLDEKLHWMETTFFPAWEAAGSPEPMTPECHKFTALFFTDANDWTC